MIIYCLWPLWQRFPLQGSKKVGVRRQQLYSTTIKHGRSLLATGCPSLDVEVRTAAGQRGSNT